MTKALNVFFATSLLMLFASMGGASAATAAGTAVDVSIVDAVPVANNVVAAQDFKLTIEYRVGLWAYEKVATADFRVARDGESTIIVNFKGWPYVATFKVRGEALNFGEGTDTWALFVSRQDTVEGKAIDKAKTARFFIDKGHEQQTELSGMYEGQRQDIRLTFAY